MAWVRSNEFIKQILLVWAMLVVTPHICNAAVQGNFTQAQRYERHLEAGKIDEFLFDVSQSKVVHLRIATKDPKVLLPSIWLYGPSSKLIAQHRSGPMISLDCSSVDHRCRITETGKHRLVIINDLGAGPGNYYIELLQLDGINPAANFADIKSDVATARKGSVNMHGISANPSSTMHFKVSSIGKSLIQPKIWLYSPSGRILFESNQNWSTHFICGPSDSCRFTETGRHSLVVTHYGEEDGEYLLNVVNIPSTLNASLNSTGSSTATQSSSKSQVTGGAQPDIARQEALRAYQAKYPNGVFFTAQDEANDTLQFLGGQCVAWAERLYDTAATKPISNYSFNGAATNISDVLEDKGYTVVKDPKAPKVGALIVWEEPDKYAPGKDGAGHVGVVTGIKQGPLREGGSYEILVSEANFPDTGSKMTEELAATWGLSAEEAKREIVTTSYGVFQERVFDTSSLNRGSYKFKAYVYP